MANWTIGGELMRLASASSVADAIAELRLAPGSSNDVQLSLTESWARGGAETYMCRFEIVCGIAERRSYVMKAVAAYSPANSIGTILETWVDRRHLLEKAGIASPSLYYFGEGVLIEDDIRFDFGDFMSTNGIRVDLAIELVEYAAALTALRFRPISPFEDLRTDGSHLLVVDFGEDLGSPYVAVNARPLALLEQALAWLAKHWGLIELHRDELEACFLAKVRSLGLSALNH